MRISKGTYCWFDWLVCCCANDARAGFWKLSVSMFWPELRMYSPILRFVANSLATHRSTQTDSPLLRSSSPYHGGMHLVLHELRMLTLVKVQKKIKSRNYFLLSFKRLQKMHALLNLNSTDTYLLKRYVSDSTSSSAMRIFSSSTSRFALNPPFKLYRDILASMFASSIRGSKFFSSRYLLHGWFCSQICNNLVESLAWLQPLTIVYTKR